MFALLTQMGAVRGNALVEAADGPDVLWWTVARGAGLTADEAVALRALILRKFAIRR